MSESTRRTRANQANAKASTGPSTALGKAKSSANAISHGVLSLKLLLADESATDYKALLQTLMAELGAVGTMEQLLVERIAISIWRQRRMVGAESASVTEQQALTEYNTLIRVRSMARLSATDDDWIKSILQDLPSPDIYTSRIASYEGLQGRSIELAALKRECPDAWSELCDEAEVDDTTSHVVQCDVIQGFVDENYECLDDWVSHSLYSLRKTQRLIVAANTVRSALAVPKNPDLLSRYQAALDNEWFKGLRALREAQKFRLEQAALNAKAVPAEPQ